jgi:nitroreductase
MNMMLAARSMGIGSVWLSFPDSVEIKWHFNIPKTMGIAAMLNFGYPDRWPEIPDVIGADDPRFWPRRPVENMVHYEKFDEDKWQKETRNLFMYGPVIGKDRYLEIEAKK